jgi:hypothetical protein
MEWMKVEFPEKKRAGYLVELVRCSMQRDQGFAWEAFKGFRP